MLKIVALNEAEIEDESNDEGTVTNEAQETIVESEYMRALKLRYNGNIDVALSLLNELLETKVLNELCNNSKLWSIRYNCYKNIALIYEEKHQFELALHNYHRAMQIDKTDVHMLHKFGQLALKCNALELAECAFENCLKRNPTHWSAADGLLRTYCHRRNVLAAYGLALKLFRRDNNYKHAAKVLKVIKSQFNNLLDIFWSKATRDELTTIDKLVPDNVFNEVFPRAEGEELKPLVVVVPENIEQFRIMDLNWLTIAEYITQVYNYLAESQQSMLYTMNYDDLSVSSTHVGKDDLQKIFKEKEEQQEEQKLADTGEENCLVEQCEPNEPKESADVQVQDCQGLVADNAAFASPVAEGGKTPTVETMGNNDDSDSNTKSDSNDGSNNNNNSNKPKVKRRCSDLHMLEQWGWHKSRRYSSRKKTKDRPELDTSLNSFLRRSFSKFTSTTFEDSWPFNEETANDGELSEMELKKSCEFCHGNNNYNLEDFRAATKGYFEDFIDRLKVQKFDLMFLIFEWLREISALFQLKLPEVIRIKYLEIFQLYLKHYDWSNWNQMNAEDLEASYRICLLNLELEHEQIQNSNGEVTELWHDVLNHLLLLSGAIYVGSKHKTMFFLRLAHLQYALNSHKKNFEMCLLCFDQMSQLMSDEKDDYALHMPNLQGGCLTKKSIIQTRIQFERQLLLTKVPSLFEAKKWNDLIEIITSNIRQLRDQYECENWSKDFRVQIELLLNAFWHSKSYENCITWVEMFFHYTTDQYLKEARTSTYRQKLWAQSINFIMSYMESIVLNEGYDILLILHDMQARLVQNIIRLLVYQLDAPIDKHNNAVPDFEIKRFWIILHQIMLREECQHPVLSKLKSSISSDSSSSVVGNTELKDEEEMMPNSFLLLFTAHQFLGKRQWCTRNNGEFLHYILDMVTPNLRAPLYDTCRDAVYEHIEQITYCLYGYPQKKARLRHLEEHESQQQDLTWPRAMQIFTLYKPECLPEFNSYKLESITADQEQLLLKIIALIPKDICPTQITHEITQLLPANDDNCDFELDKSVTFTLPYQINSIFYLLADYYFKNRDFIKAIKFYTLDLACNPLRFDSWAGMALSKASRIETKLNCLLPLNFTNLLSECDDVIICFKRCIALNRALTLLWIEYGSFAYTIHSYCSRHLKHESEKLSIEHFSFAEDRKNKMLGIAFDCFSLAAQLQEAHAAMHSESHEDNSEGNEEKWLCQYMLGKIAEKRKDEPQIYLNCYLKAATYLYESNATYPIKINHSNPTTLSVEALEVFYRTNSAIIKFIEHTNDISRENGLLFKNVLNNLSNSPFAFNKAKIDGNSLNALKRKMNDKQSTSMPAKCSRQQGQNSPLTVVPKTDVIELEDKTDKPIDSECQALAQVQEIYADKITETPTISTTTITTTTITTNPGSTTSTTTTSTSESSRSGSESDSESTSAETEGTDSKKGKAYTPLELDMIYKKVIQNLEECITRFSEHYKSIYRLVYHYLNGPATYCDYERCEELLLGQYRTALGNQINGLFAERKNNNLFNGIWRIPSSEIDRPGSFSAQLVKCVSILIQVLMKNNNHKLLIDIGLQLFKTPDIDKRYIKDSERLELYQQAIDFCTRIMQNTLRQYVNNRNDEELLTLLVDLYRIHKKCQKYMNQKEPQFCQLMVDAYKLYVQDKIELLPEHLNLFDLAIKLCIQELGLRKNIEKAGMDIAHVEAQAALTRKNNIPGLLMRRGRVQTANKMPGLGASNHFSPQLFEALMPSVLNSNQAHSQAQTQNQNQIKPTNSNTNTFNSLPFQPNSLEFQRLCEEYYTQICKSGQINPVPMLSYPQALMAMAESAHRSMPQSEKSFLPIARPASADNMPMTSLSSTITMPPSSTTTSSNNANMNLLQKLPPSLDVTALMKAPTTVMPTLPVALSNVDSTVTVTPVHGANFREIPLAELTTSLGNSTESSTMLQNKIKRPSKKARNSPFQRPLVLETTKTATAPISKNVNKTDQKMNYLDLLASSICNKEISLMAATTTSGTTTAVSITSSTKQRTLITKTKSTKSNVNPFSINMMGNDHMGGGALNFSNTALYNTSIIPVSATTTRTAQTGLQKPPPPAQSPTKTLQQKLVERQKANALNDLKQTQNAAGGSKPKIDVIYID